MFQKIFDGLTACLPSSETRPSYPVTAYWVRPRCNLRLRNDSASHPLDLRSRSWYPASIDKCLVRCLWHFSPVGEAEPGPRFQKGAQQPCIFTTLVVLVTCDRVISRLFNFGTFYFHFTDEIIVPDFFDRDRSRHL